MIRDCQKIERVDVSRVARSLSWPVHCGRTEGSGTNDLFLVTLL